ncbi:MAG: helix-turn-helix transcriptional regulator [Desulfovermiculus sp.]|nr:helix-turn-helix transcriptional regulator [Desulfovermiculus sp.]
MRKAKTDIEFEESSGNVFADLELPGADELQARAMIGCHVIQLLKEKKMKQRELADLLGIKQVEVSHLLNGHFSRFTTDKLLDFLKRMDQKVTIRISPHKNGEPYQNVFCG